MTTTSSRFARRRGFGFPLAVLLSAGALAQEPADRDERGPVPDGPAAQEAAVVDAAAEPALASAGDSPRRDAGRGVMDEIELGRSEITGDQSLPKVLYIVPWQKAVSGDFIGRPVNTLLDEVLAPLNRDEFLRRIDYYQELYAPPE